MNDALVSIKVDREERPDIDKMYVQVAQMMTGRGIRPSADFSTFRAQMVQGTALLEYYD
jgi:uncharacterized protein YyaL (SSP411 family)